MAWFEAFRNEHGFASYNDNRTPVTYDIPLLTVTYLCVLVSIATLIATLGIRGRERWSCTLRAIYAVGIGSIILACLVGYGWQEGYVKVKAHYVYRNNLPFDGYVGIKVALDAANVTLHGYYRSASGPGYVFYAESMPWSEFGFQSERYSYFLHKGLPEPILRVMEFLTMDEGGLRWGRSFHTSGHYAMALLWTSFAFWIVSNVLLCSVIVYGAYMFTLTGVTMILACVTYHACQCPLPLAVSFGEHVLRVSYSWCYWLTLAAGCLTMSLGLVLIVTDHFAHDGVSEFFHLEKLSDDDYTEHDDHPENYKTLLMDRRGTIVPPPNDRRESIFLEPCRQPTPLQDMLKTSFLPGKAVFALKSPDNGAGHSKGNPLYEDDMTVKSLLNGPEDITVEMERVCDKSDVCMNTKTPSLATIKEDRDNHANEKLSSSTSSSDTPSSRYVWQGQHSRRDSDQVMIFTTGISDKLHGMFGRRKQSCHNNVASPPFRERSISETSEESDAAESLHQSSSQEVLVCVESQRDLHEDSATTELKLMNHVNEDSTTTELKLMNHVNEDSTTTELKLMNHVNEDSTTTELMLRDHVNEDSTTTELMLMNHVNEDSTTTELKLMNHVNEDSTTTELKLMNHVNEDSTTTEPTLMDRVRVDSAETTECNDNESGIDTRKNSHSSCESHNSDVVVNIF